ncbi:MAG: CHAT domain-containing protein [Bacteroidota bacterium]
MNPAKEDALKYSLLILFLLIPLWGWAQQSSGQELFHKADSLQHAARYDTSNQYYQKAADIFEKSESYKDQFRAFYQTSLNKAEQGEREEASEFLDRAWTIAREHFPDDENITLRYYHQKGVLAAAEAEYQTALDWYDKGLALADSMEKSTEFSINMNTGRAEVYISQGNYSEAVELLSEAQDRYHQNRVENEQLLSSIYNNRGTAHQNMGEYQTAHTYFDRALELDEQRLPHPHPDLARRYNNVALVYYYQSDYQRALDHMTNAANVLASFHGEDHRLVGVAYNNIGIVYSEIEEFEKATEYLKKSLDIREKVLGETHPDVAIGYQNLGAIYSDMEQYDQAIEQYQKAKELHLDRFPDGHPELANVYANLGEAYGYKSEYQKALDFYFKDLEMNREMRSADHPYIGDTFSKIGQTYALMENYDQALDYYDRAQEVLITDYSSENPFRELSLNDTGYPELLLTVLRFKADAQHQKAITEENNRQLDRSLQTYLQAVSFIDDLQQSLSREESKFYLRERTNDIYEKGFTVARKLLENTGETDYQNHLFYFAQKSRNQILLEQVQELDNQKFAQIPDSLIAREQRLRSQITDWQQQLSGMTSREQETDSTERVAIQDSLFHTQKQLQDHTQRLKDSYPEYYGLKFEPPVTTIDEVQKNLLATDEAMLSYFFVDESLFAMVISEQSFEVKELPVDSTLSGQISDYRDTISKTSDLSTFTRQSHQLYTKLLEPVSDFISDQDLLIIPDGALHYLPFESLVTDAPEDTADIKFRDFSYVINNHAVGYASSAGLLELQKQQSPPEYEKAFWGMAPAFGHVSTSNQRTLYPGYDRPLSPLLFNEREVRKLKNLFNKRDGLLSFMRSEKDDADIVVGETATEAQFKQANLNDYRIIHLATHAFVDEEHPEHSGILFSTPDNQEDGTLYASEIYNLNFDAELVALSACHTGMGTIAEGEGIIGLSRAFQYGGAQNLLVSLWSVDDRSTEQLMVGFYEQRQQQKRSAEALRQAKLQMINHSQYSHPRYWAPFVFIGQ